MLSNASAPMRVYYLMQAIFQTMRDVALPEQTPLWDVMLCYVVNNLTACVFSKRSASNLS